MAAIAAAASVSSAKSRSDTRVERVGGRAVEAERLGRHLPVDREGGAGERGGAQRTLVEPRARIGEPAAVARQHLDVGEEMVAEGHGLGRLQMREARHDEIEVRLRLARERQLQRRRARASAPSSQSRT